MSEQAAWIKHLAWDSEFFGAPIAKTRSLHLQPHEVDRVLAECEAAGVKCLYCELDPHELDTLVYVQRLGFQLVEFRLVLAHDLRHVGAGELAAGGVEIDDCPQPEDAADLARIAAAIAPTSRFAADRRFGPDASRRLYARWLQSCLEDAAVRVIVARLVRRAVGLVTIKPHGEVMQLTLLGVAPELRGRGIGLALVHAAVQASAAAGSARLELITQGHNLGAVRTYERAGFLMAAGSYYFHKWWE